MVTAPRSDYDACRGGQAIRSIIQTLLNVLLVSGLLMAALGLLRVRFAVRFWRRMQWLAWAYIGVVVLSAAMRLTLAQSP